VGEIGDGDEGGWYGVLGSRSSNKASDKHLLMIKDDMDAKVE
jgi:hypothetical protein